MYLYDIDYNYSNSKLNTLLPAMTSNHCTADDVRLGEDGLAKACCVAGTPWGQTISQQPLASRLQLIFRSHPPSQGIS
jgi:hypothetical protein